MYEERFYRKDFSKDWFSYEVHIKETDILVKSKARLVQERIVDLTAGYRQDIEKYIEAFPEFKTTLSSFKMQGNPCAIVKEMIEKSSALDIGPMACVAGALAEYIGKDLLGLTDGLVVENGGDVFIKKQGRILLGIYAGPSSRINEFLLSIENTGPYLGICSSSSLLGHSLSLGRADMATVVSDSSIFADGLATKLANMVHDEDDIDEALAFARRFSLTKAVSLVKGQKIGVWGGVRLVKR